MTNIQVKTSIKCDIKKVWEYFTKPKHIVKWNHASDDWNCPYAENDFHVGGKFLYTMSAKDGSASFDFEGVYTDIKKFKLIEYDINDGRHVKVQITSIPNGTKITETFEAENTNPVKLQKDGWQAILDNLRKYTESDQVI